MKALSEKVRSGRKQAAITAASLLTLAPLVLAYRRMKVCPFCKERIHHDAVKCRYCASSLMLGTSNDPKPQEPLENSSHNSNRVVYILDKDLIRFAKFAIAVLAVFVAVGAFLWGFDVKKAAKEVHDAADETKMLQSQASATLDQIRLAQKSVSAQLAMSRQLNAQAQEAVDSILKKDKEVTLIITRISARVSGGELQTDSAGTEQRRFAPNIARLYGFPANLTGKGQRIGVLELGGGYDENDLKEYFKKLSLPVPKITCVSVDGATNNPSGDPGSADSQVTCDIEIASSVAPGAELVIYFAPNTDSGYAEGIHRAISDTNSAPAILFMGWGSPEINWSAASMTRYNSLFQEASLRGISVIAAAGDHGTTDGVTDGRPHVDFPASSPWVVGCGGTNLKYAGDTINAETLWDEGEWASGRGVSDVFPLPEWQSLISPRLRADGKKGRLVPDVAVNGIGCSCYICKAWVSIKGTTSAVSQMAGLLALLNEAIGTNVGFLNPVIYRTLGPKGGFRSVVNHSSTRLGNGQDQPISWNEEIGWGSPVGSRLIELLASKVDSPLHAE